MDQDKVTMRDVPDWLRRDFERGYTPSKHWPSYAEKYWYSVWKRNGGVVTPPNSRKEKA